MWTTETNNLVFPPEWQH